MVSYALLVQDVEMAHALLNTAKIYDWESFHNVCAEAFGFPDFYGRNMNAWIDCLTYLHEGDGMSRFVLAEGEHLFILVLDFGVFAAVLPEIANAFLSCVAFADRLTESMRKRPR